MGKYNKYLTKGYVQILPHVPSYPWALPEMCQSLKCHPSHSKYHQRCHAMPFLQRIIGFIFVTKVVALKQRCHSWLWTVMSSDFIVCVCVCVCAFPSSFALSLCLLLFSGGLLTPLSSTRRVWGLWCSAGCQIFLLVDWLKWQTCKLQWSTWHLMPLTTWQGIT